MAPEPLHDAAAPVLHHSASLTHALPFVASRGTSPQAAIVCVGAILAYVVGAFLAIPFRDALMIETPRAPEAASKAPGARAESDRFLSNRDTVVVRVPRAMSVGEFLDVYHLRNTRGIREALQRQAGVHDDTGLLSKDKELRLHLTVPYR
jgi:hypothetical protein